MKTVMFNLFRTIVFVLIISNFYVGFHDEIKWFSIACGAYLLFVSIKHHLFDFEFKE